MTQPWAAPDERAEDAPAVVVPVAKPVAVAMAVGAAPELPVPLRPLSVSDRIDGALRVLKLAPGPVVALAAVAVVPVQLVAALVLGNGPTDLDGNEQLEAVLGKPIVSVFLAESGGQAVSAALLVLLEVLAVSFVACGLGTLVTGWYLEGRVRSAGELVAGAAARLPAVAAAWFLVHVVELAFGAVVLLPALIPMTWFAIVAPLVGAEAIGPLRAMRRSFDLTRRAFWSVLGTCLLVALLDVVLRFALTALGFVYVDLDLPAAWAVSTAVAIAARLVTVPFVAGCAVLLYLDLRIRLEGLDIDLAADERFPDAR